MSNGDESPETRIALLESDVENLKQNRKDDRKDIDSLKLWRGWITGSAATFMFFVGLFAAQLKKILGN